jgi:transglutaminase-like putative cysteine protease
MVMNRNNVNPAPVLFAAIALLLLLSSCMQPLPFMVPLPVGVPALSPPGKTMTLNRVVRYEHRLVNESDRPATMEMFVALPQDNERQTIRFLRPDPTFVNELVDEYGNRILHYVDRYVPPGEVVAHGWIAEVDVSSIVYGFPAPGAKAEELTAEEIKIFLRDGESYDIESDTVSDLAGELAEGSPHPAETVRRVYRYLVENLTYARDDVWDPAPVVLKRGTGSCSEYNYAFLALCRAAGIPARYTGGLVLRSDRAAAYDKTVTEDAVFHRWSEVFLPGLGWFPVDCSRASGEMKRFGNPDNYFGRLPAGLLQCVRGDGLGGTPLGWDYLSNQVVPFETKDWSGKVAFWVAGLEPGDLEKRFGAIEGKFAGREGAPRAALGRGLFDELLASPLDREILFLFRNRIDEKSLPVLVDALLAVRHPEAVYWSLLAGQRGMALPSDRVHEELCGPYLKEQIAEYYTADDGTKDLFTFEYWWRKARPKTRWDEETGRFILTSRKINIY